MTLRLFAFLTSAVLGCSSSSSTGTPSTPPGPDAGDAGTTPDEASTPDVFQPSTDAPAADTGHQPIPMWTAFGARANDARWGVPFAYATASQSFLGFSGADVNGNPLTGTYSLSMTTGSYTKLTDVSPPGPRYCGCTTYLPDQDQVLLVGGRDANGPLPAAAWTLDVATSMWTSVAGSVPGGVIGCAAAYVATQKRAYVFGGGATSFLNETWSYDPVQKAFTKLSPAKAPPGRADAIAAYDPGDGGRMLLFSGTANEVSSTNHFNDLWAFDGTSWTELMPTGGPPPPRRVTAGGFDPVRRTWLIFSGTVESSDLADVWLLDVAGLAWTNLTTLGAPKARGFASSGFDPQSNSLVVVGGLQQPSFAMVPDGWKVQLQ